MHHGLRVIAWLIPVRRQREQPVLERRELLSLSGGSCRRGLATISRALGKLCGERGCPRAPAAPTPDAFPPRDGCPQLRVLLPRGASTPQEAGGAVTTHRALGFWDGFLSPCSPWMAFQQRLWPARAPRSRSETVRGARASASALCPGKGVHGGASETAGQPGVVRSGPGPREPSRPRDGTGCAVVLLSQHD